MTDYMPVALTSALALGAWVLALWYLRRYTSTAETVMVICAATATGLLRMLSTKADIRDVPEVIVLMAVAGVGATAGFLRQQDRRWW